MEGVALGFACGGDRFVCIFVPEGSNKVRLKGIGAALALLKGVSLFVAGRRVLEFKAGMVGAILWDHKIDHRAKHRKARDERKGQKDGT